MCLKPQVRELVLKERQLIFKIQKVKVVLQYWFLHNWYCSAKLHIYIMGFLRHQIIREINLMLHFLKAEFHLYCIFLTIKKLRKD